MEMWKAAVNLPQHAGPAVYDVHLAWDFCEAPSANQPKSQVGLDTFGSLDTFARLIVRPLQHLTSLFSVV